MLDRQSEQTTARAGILRRRFSLGPLALLGASGSALMAVASDLPGSPYGPHAAGLWPLAAGGPAPAWEGPELPSWAGVADQAAGVGPGHLVVMLLAVGGIVVLGVAWALLWRQARTSDCLDLQKVCWLGAAWVAPLLFAAPFASQDVWLYGAQGEMVLKGLGGYSFPALLGHSVWLRGVDPQWAAHPSLYGPLALDLATFFVWAAPWPWLAAECWRVAAVIGLGLSAWGVNRAASLRSKRPIAAVVIGIANPGLLVVLVGGIHNDSLMLGLMVAGVSLALSHRPLPGAMLCALAVGIKPAALLGVGALAWWAWGRSWRDRTTGAVVGATSVASSLLVAGLGVGGGFAWLKSFFSYSAIPGPFSLGVRFLSASSGGVVDAIELAGVALAIGLVIVARGPSGWIPAMGWGLAALALTTTKPEPWYLGWAVALLACDGLSRRSDVFGALLLVTMVIGSSIAFGTFWWFAGAIALAWFGISALLPGSRGGHGPPNRAAAAGYPREQLDGS